MISVATTIEKLDDLTTFAKSLTSLSFADEIRIYAMRMSGDKKLKSLAKRHKAQIIDVTKPPVVEVIRSRQVKDSKYDWVLIVDFDEIIPPATAKEILTVSKADKSEIGIYAIPRHNYSLGHRLKRGGWGDDYQMRLVYLPLFKSWPRTIHSTPHSMGKLAKLHNAILHYKDASLEVMVEKTNRYSDAESDLYYKSDTSKIGSIALLRKSIMEVLRRGFFKFGLFDGPIGVVQSLYQGFSVFITYAKLYEKQND